MSSLEPYYEEYAKTIEELNSIESDLASGRIQYRGLLMGIDHTRKVETAVQRREKFAWFFVCASLVALVVAGVFFVRHQETEVVIAGLVALGLFTISSIFWSRIGYLRTGVSSDYENEYTDKIKEINDGLRDLTQFPSSTVTLDATLGKIRSLKAELEQKRETADRQQAEVELVYA